MRDNALRILQRGAAIIRTTDADGKERPRDYMAPGRFYGQSSLFRRERHETTVRAVRPDSVGSATGILTSPQGESDRAHASEPGATWFRIRSEDLIYLLHSDPGGSGKIPTWSRRSRRKRRNTASTVGRTRTRCFWYDGHRHVIVLLRSFLIPALPVVGMILLKLILQNWDINLTILTVALVSGMVAAPLTVWYVVDYLNDYFVVTSLRVTTARTGGAGLRASH
ncbi:MAG: hypothetical protein IPO15_13480 [Anaerolineae bacterium]|nr:hypothetical protein [Anaerolineae bacterium]